MRALFIALLALPAATSAEDAPVRAVTTVESIGLTVGDLEREVRFFTEVLDFELVGERELAGREHAALEGLPEAHQRVARLRLGAEEIELTEWLAPAGLPYPPGSRSNDRWFQHIAIVVSDMQRAYAHLRANDVEHASSGPQRLPDWNPNAGGIEAFYFRDPEGHVLEVIAFPEGKGAPRWQALERERDDLFLGIDHTAIVVDDTERSLAFWRDALGLAVAGESENWGDEQEHLNGVFAARLRITGLRAASGPGVELLEYLSPRDGRPYPSDARANDLVHWEIRLSTQALDPLREELAARGAPFVSARIGRLQGGERRLLVRDPDGHAAELLEQSAGSN